MAGERERVIKVKISCSTEHEYYFMLERVKKIKECKVKTICRDGDLYRRIYVEFAGSMLYNKSTNKSTAL